MGCSFAAAKEDTQARESIIAEFATTQVTELVTGVVLKLFGVPLVVLVVTVLSLPDSMVIAGQAAVVVLVTGLALMWTARSYKDLEVRKCS